MSLNNLKKEAKRWLRAVRSNDPEARARLERAYPAAGVAPVLRDVQHALAIEYGYKDWAALKLALTQPFHEAAEAFVDAYEGDAAALDRLNRHYGRTFTFDDLRAEIWRRVYAFRQRSSRVPKNFLKLDEAQIMVAQDAGFASWTALITGGTRVDAFELDAQENRIAPRRRLESREWDALIAAIEDRKITRVEANGEMTDAVLARIAQIPHVTSLVLGGSRELTDDGLLHLARMPQLEHLDMGEYPGGKLTDRGLEVLRHLPNLRRFDMAWQSAMTDRGVAYLRHCDQLESVNLMGSPTGDGAIEALQGKPKLRKFRTGRLVTDAGLALLHNFPLLKTAHEGNEGHLLIDGPFTNAGLALLAGLEGVFDLDLFWHVTGITTDAFVHFAGLPNLSVLGCDGHLSDNTAMRHFAAIPRLRRLRAQESAADDDGFVELSRSKTLEGLWGRECPKFGSRGFIALSKMPALRSMGISCANVSDDALATLPDFPSLREITPIGFTDAGFRHIGRCDRIERLTCMYCRETGDAATEHIVQLPLKYYYAGLTKITDRSLAILGQIATLEQIEFYECNGITDAGLPNLVGLPHLREVHIDSSPGVTLAGTRVFPANVRVLYTT